MHGQVINLMFQRYPQFGDDAPNKRTSSDTEERAPDLEDLTPSPTLVPDQSLPPPSNPVPYPTRVSTSED